MNKFDYVKLDEQSVRDQEEIKKGFEVLNDLLESKLQCPSEKKLCLAKLEECYMWAGKCLRTSQIDRDKNNGVQSQIGDEGQDKSQSNSPDNDILGDDPSFDKGKL